MTLEVCGFASDLTLSVDRSPLVWKLCDLQAHRDNESKLHLIKHVIVQADLMAGFSSHFPVWSSPNLLRLFSCLYIGHKSGDDYLLAQSKLSKKFITVIARLSYQLRQVHRKWFQNAQKIHPFKCRTY